MWYTAIVIFFLAMGYTLSRVGAHIVFRPQKKRWPLQLPFQNVHIGPITGIYLPTRGEQPTLLFFHGRGGNVSHFENFAHVYAPLGYGVLAFDYRGFGLSKGTPSQKHLEQDAVSAVTYALEKLHLPPQQLVIYGHSLGNAPALFAAQHFKNTPFKALILQSPFLSTPDMAASWACGAYAPHTWKYQLIRAFVTPFLWFNRFDNTRHGTGLMLPVLVCFSKADQTLPWAQSAKLADHILHVQRFLSPTGGHDEFSWSATAVDSFLQTH